MEALSETLKRISYAHTTLVPKVDQDIEEDCRTCGGARFVRRSGYDPGRGMSMSDGLLLGEIVSCPHCEWPDSLAAARRRETQLLATAGFRDGRQPLGRLETYNGQDPPASNALASVNEWLTGSQPRLLVLFGGFASGKSHLAEAAAYHLAVVKVARVAIMDGDELKAVHGRNLDGEADQRRRSESELRSRDWLILDQFYRPKPYIAELIAEVLTFRFGAGLPSMLCVSGEDAGAVRSLLGERLTARLERRDEIRVVDMRGRNE